MLGTRGTSSYLKWKALILANPSTGDPSGKRHGHPLTATQNLQEEGHDWVPVLRPEFQRLVYESAGTHEAELSDLQFYLVFSSLYQFHGLVGSPVSSFHPMGQISGPAEGPLHAAWLLKRWWSQGLW